MQEFPKNKNMILLIYSNRNDHQFTLWIARYEATRLVIVYGSSKPDMSKKNDISTVCDMSKKYIYITIMDHEYNIV